MTIPVFVESLLKTISHSDAEKEKKKQDNKARYAWIQRNARSLSDCLTFFTAALSIGIVVEPGSSFKRRRI